MVLPPDDPSDEAREEELPEDFDTPFSLPEDDPVNISDGSDGPKRPPLDDTHPATDSNFEISEAYQAGLSDTADAREPNANDTAINEDGFDDEDESV